MPPAPPTCYDTLEIRSDATFSDIGRAFAREKAKLSSLLSNTPAWQQRREDVERAYHVLSESKSRADYDRQLAASRASPSQSLAEANLEGDIDTFIGATAAGETQAQESRYKLALRKASRTEEGIEIELAPSAWSRTAVTEELRRHVPSGFLRFNSSRNSWTVAEVYEAALGELFLNLDHALGEDGPQGPQVFNIPSFQVPRTTVFEGVRPSDAKDPVSSERQHSRWTANINGTTLGIAGVVLLIGWNLYVAGSQRQQEEDSSSVVVSRPTLVPLPTNTPVPTPTPIPVSLLITSKYPRVHLRAGPSQSTASLGFILAEEEVTAIGRTPNVEWIQIEKQELTGWSAAWTLNGGEEFGDLPVVVP